MGSTPSTNVKPIDSELGEVVIPRSCSSSRLSNAGKKGKKKASNRTIDSNNKVQSINTDLEKCIVAKEEAEQKVEDMQAKLQEMESQMAELESNNLDLMDEVQALEEKMDSMYANSLVKEEKDCSQTMKAKDQYIAKLEAQTKAVENQIVKLKSKCRKKIKSVNAQLMEAQQESGVKTLELKEEIAKLLENNRKLQKENGSNTEPTPTVLPVESKEQPTSNGAAVSDTASEDQRMNLILELSSKVSEQEMKIMELEKKLSERDKQLEGMRGTAGRSVHVSASKKTQSNHWASSNSENCDIIENASFKNTWKDEEDISELKQVAQEMKKYQRKKKRHAKQASDGKREVREWSGLSQDSGIIPGEGEHSLSHRVSSATSNFSNLSDEDDDKSLPGSRITSASKRQTSANSQRSFTSDLDCNDLDSDGGDSKSINTVKLNNIRQISAPKKKKDFKTLDFDELLNDVSGGSPRAVPDVEYVGTAMFAGSDNMNSDGNGLPISVK